MFPEPVFIVLFLQHITSLSSKKEQRHCSRAAVLYLVIQAQPGGILWPVIHIHNSVFMTTDDC